MRNGPVKEASCGQRSMINSFLAFFGLTSGCLGLASRIIHGSSVGIPPSDTFGDPADTGPIFPSLIGVFLDIWTT